MKIVCISIAFITSMIFWGCTTPQRESQHALDVQEVSITEDSDIPFVWENATIYFLLLDRFNNGDTTNDLQFERTPNGAKLRSFMGGDFKGVSQKIAAGYFDDLGVNAIWFTPPVEQIRGSTDEGTGKTYAYHGYWARDWTALDPNFGTEEEFAEMIQLAHEHGIRIVWDAVLNHTGPVTPTDPQWPEAWVRTEPYCNFQDYEGTVTCALVKNLPDIKTEKEMPVELPQFLLDKWKQEGRLEKELGELEEFFERTGFPRAPKYYLIKWLTDWIREYGVDAFRVDTAKHTEAEVWDVLKKEAEEALVEWKQNHPALKPDDLPFFMTGEVFGYSIHNGREYDYGDRKIDFFENGFESLINFSFKVDAENDFETLFNSYSDALHADVFSEKTVVNYMSSHDDGSPFDRNRKRVLETGTKLLLTPGIAQIYYGDETARDLDVNGTQGDAHLRSFMNWDELSTDIKRGGEYLSDILAHWQKLGRFRREHIAVGAGVHQMLLASPYTFHRSYTSNTVSDDVIVVLEIPAQMETYELDVQDIFSDGTRLKDYYSDGEAIVEKGKVKFNNIGELLLVGEPR